MNENDNHGANNNGPLSDSSSNLSKMKGIVNLSAGYLAEGSEVSCIQTNSNTCLWMFLLVLLHDYSMFCCCCYIVICLSVCLFNILFYICYNY